MAGRPAVLPSLTEPHVVRGGPTSASCESDTSTRVLAAGCTTSSNFMMVAPSFEIVTRPCRDKVISFMLLPVCDGVYRPTKSSLRHRGWCSAAAEQGSRYFVTVSAGNDRHKGDSHASLGGMIATTAALALRCVLQCASGEALPYCTVCIAAGARYAVLRSITLSSWMSLSIPLGPNVVRTVSARAMHALMLLTSCGVPWLVSVPSLSKMICGCCTQQIDQ